MKMDTQQQVQFDVYYQGSTSQLYGLLYPLGGPNAPIFQHLNQQKATYDPQSKQLAYTYSPQNFENIDKQKQEIRYTSKPVQNLSNYFYSTFHQDTGCFVWRNLNKFLEMRPENRVHVDENAEKNGSKQSVKDNKTGKKENVGEGQNEEQSVVELEVVESGEPGNVVEKEIADAPVTEVKPVWHCSKDQYFSYLAH